LPVNPIMLAVYSQVTMQEVSIFHSHFPGFLFVGLSYYILIREYTSDTIAVIFSLLGSIGTNIGPINAMGISSFKYGILVLFVYLTYRQLGTDNRDMKLAYLCGSFLFTIWMFYTYPRLFFNILAISLMSLFLLSLKRESNLVTFVSSTIIGIMAFLQVFEIPLNSYYYAFISVLQNLSQLDLIIPFVTETSTTDQPVFVLENTPYSLITLAALAIPAIIGGKSAIVQSFSEVADKNQRYRYTTLSIWGLATIFVAVLHMASGKSWIASRVFVLSFPLVLIGAALFVDNIESRKFGYVVCSVIVLAVIIPFILISASTWVGIHSYTEQEVSGADWASQHGQSVSGDLKIGAQVLAQEKTEFVYPSSPDREKKIRAAFYSTDRDEYQRYIDSEGVDNFILYEGMVKEGFFIPGYMREPTTQKAVSARKSESSTTYTNGEVYVLSE